MKAHFTPAVTALERKFCESPQNTRICDAFFIAQTTDEVTPGTFLSHIAAAEEGLSFDTPSVAAERAAREPAHAGVPATITARSLHVRQGKDHKTLHRPFIVTP